MMKRLGSLYILLIMGVLFLPLIIVAGVSVNERKRLFFPPQGFSVHWYGELFADGAWFNAFQNSVLVAVLASVVAVSIALPIAIYLWRANNLFARMLFGLGLAPFMLPPVITALGLLIFWVQIGHSGATYATIISHAVFLVTLPLVTISLGLQSINKQLIEAARTMGANEVTIFRTVIFPLVTPYIVSGFAFAFVLSLNEYIIAFMVAGFTVETLPIKIFNSLRYGYTPVMAVVAVFFAAISVLVFGLIAKFGDLPQLLGAEAKDRT
ncbi:MAG: ABC transporter permease [Pseudomonadota bacterium]